MFKSPAFPAPMTRVLRTSFTDHLMSHAHYRFVYMPFSLVREVWEAVLNSQNNHVWADENPYAECPRGFLEQYSFNIWAGFLDGCVIGPYLLPPNLTGAAYLRFLEGVLHGHLEDVLLHMYQIMWFEHNGTPPHFSLAVRDHLDQRFRQQWIGRGGPIVWHPRSPDLTPLYYLWSHMKSLIYKTPVASEEDLLIWVKAAADVGG